MATFAKINLVKLVLLRVGVRVVKFVNGAEDGVCAAGGLVRAAARASAGLKGAAGASAAPLHELALAVVLQLSPTRGPRSHLRHSHLLNPHRPATSNKGQSHFANFFSHAQQVHQKLRANYDKF